MTEAPQDAKPKTSLVARAIAGAILVIFLGCYVGFIIMSGQRESAATWGAAGYAFVGVADKVTGPYEHITYIAGGACDTSLFEDADGRTYAFIPRGGVDVQEIDLSGIRQDIVKLVGKPKRIVAAENADIGMDARPEYLEGP